MDILKNMVLAAVCVIVCALLTVFLLREIGRRKKLRVEHAKFSKIVEASGRILKTFRSDEVINAILELCPQLIDASAYAVWRKDRRTHKWSVLKSMGLSEEYVRSRVEGLGSDLDRKAELKGPLIVESAANPPWGAASKNNYGPEGIRSLLICPLESQGETLGTVVFYQKGPQKFNDADLRVAGAIAGLAANAINSSELYQERSDLLTREIAENRSSAFLADVGVIIGSSLDYKKTLENLAHLAVPEMADWCVVDMRNDSGGLEALAISHIDPKKVEAARRFRTLFPLSQEGDGTFALVMKTGRSVFVSHIEPEATDAIPNPEAREFIRSLNLCSVMLVPIRVRDKTTGVISFIMSESGRHYDEQDLSLAEDLARRAGLQIDNAMLYRQARVALDDREAALGKLQKQINQQAVLTAVSQSWLSKVEPQSLLDDTVFWLGEALKAQYCLVVRTRADTAGGFGVPALSGWDRNEVSAFLEHAATAELLAEIERGDAPFFFESRDKRLKRIPLFEAFGVSSGIVVQIKTPDAPYGFIGVFSTKTTAFSQDDIHFIQSIANVIAASVDRLDSEKALEASERKYRQLFDLSPEAILLTGADYKITTANPEALRMFGLNSEDLIGSDVLRLAVPEQSDRLRGLVRGKQGPSLLRDELVDMRRGDGRIFPAEISVEAIQNGGGNPAAVFCIIRDITQRKELEDMKNEFIATVSHELRTPLTSIYVSLELMAKGRLSIGGDESRILIDVAHKNCERLIHLINDFLDLQKIELNKIVFDFYEADIATLIDQCVSMNRVYAEYRTISITVEKSRESVLVRLDAERFLQVLTNLLSNAVKFSPPGGKVIVALRYQRGRVRVSVTNFGPQIPPEYQGKLFNKFVQVDSSLHRKHDGTGLGLAISKGIVEGMGGSIGFRSDPKSTEFFVDFPARIAQRERAVLN